MDIEKLVEDGARALCRKRWAECGFSEREIPGKVDRTWTEWKSDARAVLAIALRAAAEEAEAMRADWASGDFPRGALGAVSVRDRLRTLAAQLGGDND